MHLFVAYKIFRSSNELVGIQCTSNVLFYR